MTENELKIVRRAYAKQIVHAARVANPRLEEALADLRREDFLPSGPWQLMRFPGGYQRTPDDNPIYLYQDAPVALQPEKGLNNGQPSFLTLLVSAGGLQNGERAIHIGTGTGYGTALMSHLAGRDGRVVGIEFEPELASYPCAGLRDEASEKALIAAFEKRGFKNGDLDKVTKLYRTDDIPEERCWVRAPGWSLAYQ